MAALAPCSRPYEVKASLSKLTRESPIASPPTPASPSILLCVGIGSTSSPLSRQSICAEDADGAESLRSAAALDCRSPVIRALPLPPGDIAFAANLSGPRPGNPGPIATRRTRRTSPAPSTPEPPPFFPPPDPPSPARCRPAICLSRFTLDAALLNRFRELGGEFYEGSRRKDFGEGIVRATGRRPQIKKTGPSWFGLKIHAPTSNSPPIWKCTFPPAVTSACAKSMAVK